MGKISKYLNQLTIGSVFDNPGVLEAYSTDGSVLKIKPKFVAFPESTDDICKLLKFFSQLAEKDIKVAVTPRGSGLDEGGADLTNGIVISTEKLNKMLEIDTRERLVRVQSGITLRELNTALSVSGLTIPIEGKDNETIGGLISNNPIDGYAGKYGGIYDYVERIEAILANGDCLQTSRLKKYAVAKKAAEKTTEGMIYCKISKLLHENKGLLTEISKHPEDKTGYPTITKAGRRETLDLMPMFFGAQGTLGIITEVILRAVPLKAKAMRVVATFRDIKSALKYLERVKELRPLKLDFYNLKIIAEAKESGKNLDGVIRKLENGFAVYASFDERANGAMRKIMALKEKLPRDTKFTFESEKNKTILDEFENSLSNYLSYAKSSERVPVLTDFYLPPWNIESFLDDLQVLGDKLKLDLELYGSYNSSIYNLRPKFDLEEPDFNKKVTTFLKAGAYVIDRQGGKLAGGTPEGRLKAVVTNTELSKAEKKLYTEIKAIFDPYDILNPDVKLGASSKFTLTHFRVTNLPKIVV